MTFTKMLLALYPALASTIVFAFNRVDESSETSEYVIGPTVKSYTNVNKISIAPIAHCALFEDAKERDPTMIKMRSWPQRPLKWIFRRPTRLIKNQEPMVPTAPRAELPIERENELVGSIPACTLEFLSASN